MASTRRPTPKTRGRTRRRHSQQLQPNLWERTQLLEFDDDDPDPYCGFGAPSFYSLYRKLLAAVHPNRDVKLFTEADIELHIRLQDALREILSSAPVKIRLHAAIEAGRVADIAGRRPKQPRRTQRHLRGPFYRGGGDAS